MNGQNRQRYPAPTFPPPPTSEHASDGGRKVSTGLPDYAYRAMYENQAVNQYPPPPPAGRSGRSGSHSNSSQRSRQSVYGSQRGRYEEERYGNRRLEDGHYHSERRSRPSESRPRRQRSLSYDSSDRSYDSRDRRHHRDDRRRGEGRSRSRRRSRSRESDRRDRDVKQKQQRRKPDEDKKTGFAKVEEYITPFNVGILMGAMDLIGGSISLYMTNKRFSKKALAKGPAPGEPGASGGKSAGSGSADNQQDKGGRGGGGGGSSRGSHVSRSRSRRGRSREREFYSRRNSSASSVSSGSSKTSYWSRSDTRQYRHVPERLESGRVASGTRAAPRLAAAARR